MLPVLLLVTAFIVYGSLYPWQFHQAYVPGNPLIILLNSWELDWNRYQVKDTAVNIVLYMPFGAACYLWLARRAAGLRFAAPVLLALLLSSSMEMIQLFDARRFCSMIDVVTNVTGSALGMVLATRFRSRVALRPGTGGPLFLLACWTGALLFPFMPDLSTHHLNYKLLTFASPPFSAVAFFNLSMMWLAAARLTEAAVNRYVVPLLLVILPLRFFVDGITLSWLDCLPAIIAIMVWFAWPAKSPRRDAMLAALSLAAILLTGLAPFHFSATAQDFSWTPFRALFSSDWQAGFAIFFRKSFSYGSTIWLLMAAGVPLAVSALGLAAFLAALEGVQIWLPNHVAESTDPLHSLLIAWVLNKVRGRNPNLR